MGWMGFVRFIYVHYLAAGKVLPIMTQCATHDRGGYFVCHDVLGVWELRRGAEDLPREIQRSKTPFPTFPTNNNLKGELIGGRQIRGTVQRGGRGATVGTTRGAVHQPQAPSQDLRDQIRHWRPRWKEKKFKLATVTSMEGSLGTVVKQPCNPSWWLRIYGFSIAERPKLMPAFLSIVFVGRPELCELKDLYIHNTLLERVE